MSLKFSLINLAAVFVLALIFLRFMPAVPVSSVVTQKTNFFTVSGEGKVSVVPDVAVINLGVTSTQTNVKDAQSQANKVIADISQAVRDLGVDAKDIKTNNYSIYPEYNYANNNKITGYRVNVDIQMTVRDIDKANQVIDAATAKGANVVSSINLTVNEDKTKQLTQEARDKAVQEAKAKAESLARAAGIKLDRIVNVEESSMGAPRPMMALSEKAIGMGGGGDATNLQPGTTDITSMVTLYYETR